MEKYELELLESEKTLLMYFRNPIDEVQENDLNEIDVYLNKFSNIILKAEKLKEFLKYNNIEYGN